MTTAILGQGWLGTLLRESWTTPCVGTRRRAGPDTISYHWGEALPLELQKASWWIVAIPPFAGMEELTQKVLSSLPSHIRILFCSSTGVYPKEGGSWSEDSRIPQQTLSPPRCSLLASEELLLKSDQALILRLGGLVGPGRHPARHLSGQKNLPRPYDLVYLTHQRDIARILQKIVTRPWRPGLYNFFSPRTLERKNFYEEICRRQQLPLPQFEISSDQFSQTVLDGSKLQKDYDYQFLYPSPLDYPWEVL